MLMNYFQLAEMKLPIHAFNHCGVLYCIDFQISFWNIFLDFNNPFWWTDEPAQSSLNTASGRMISSNNSHKRDNLPIDSSPMIGLVRIWLFRFSYYSPDKLAIASSSICISSSEYLLHGISCAFRKSIKSQMFFPASSAAFSKVTIPDTNRPATMEMVTLSSNSFSHNQDVWHRVSINLLTQTSHIDFSYAPWKFNIWQWFNYQRTVFYAAMLQLIAIVAEMAKCWWMLQPVHLSFHQRDRSVPLRVSGTFGVASEMPLSM